jgi:hypothetical protein
MRRLLRTFNVDYVNAYGVHHPELRRALVRFVADAPLVPRFALRLIVWWLTKLRNMVAAEEVLLAWADRAHGRLDEIVVVRRLYRIGSYRPAHARWADRDAVAIGQDLGPQGLKWAALAAIQVRDWPRAEAMALEYLGHRPGARFARLALIQALIGQGRWPEARARLTAYRKDKPSCPRGRAFERDLAQAARPTLPAADALRAAIAGVRREAAAHAIERGLDG